MNWHIRIDSVVGLPDFFYVTRSTGERYNARGLRKLALAIRKEQQRHGRTFPGVPFLVRDSAGNVSAYDESTGAFTYGSPIQASPIDPLKPAA